MLPFEGRRFLRSKSTSDDKEDNKEDKDQLTKLAKPERKISAMARMISNCKELSNKVSKPERKVSPVVVSSCNDQPIELVQPDRKISETVSDCNCNKLARPERKISPLVSECNDHDQPNKLVKPERKVSASVSNYLVTVSEELKKLLHPEGLYEPELIVGLSEILDIEDVMRIKSQLLGKPSWHLAYTISLRKRSVSEIYMKLSQYQKINENENFLLIIKDNSKRVFGALLQSQQQSQKSSSLIIDTCSFNKDDKNFDQDDKIQDRDSVSLFHCRPFRQFSCCLKEHQSVVKKYADEFYIGYKDASCGIWLNENLSGGRIHEFNIKSAAPRQSVIEPKVLENKFEVKALECWSFSYAGYKPSFSNKYAN